jgi:hypothetical protein
MGKQSLPEPNPDAVFKRLDDEAVVVHLATNRIFTLSQTGARFWELLAAGKPRLDIESELCHEFDVTEAQLSAEIDSLVQALVAEDLLRWT